MSRPGQVWRAGLELSWPERRALAGAWLLLPCVAIGLRLLGFAKVQAALLPSNGARAGLTDLRQSESMARLIDVAARRSPLQTTCLTRSMVLCRQLRRRGLAADLRIGVAKPEDDFGAHAWVEHGGVALAAAGRGRGGYAAFDASVISRGL